MDHPEYLWLVPLGLVVGAFGTLIGAGGGFVLAPVLLVMYPDASPETITSISLAVVFVNAGSGSVAYGRMGRIDYRAGLVFALAAAPGAVLGALTTEQMPRRVFDAVFGVLFLALSGLLLVRSAKPSPTDGVANGGARPAFPSRGPHGKRVLGLGGLLSSAVGYVSSLLGIGGGVVHVPLLTQWLGYPVHIATATSHFVLALMALTGTLTHVVAGSFAQGVRRTLLLSVGVLVGAQLGAHLSNRVQGVWILRSLAVGLVFVGIRILLLAITG